MSSLNKLTTQLSALIAVILAWVNPDSQLSSGVQAAAIAIAGAVAAIVHVVGTIEKSNVNGPGTPTTPPSNTQP